MPTDGVEEVRENSHADAAPPLAHRRNHSPLEGRGFEPLHRGDRVSAAPTAHCQVRKDEQVSDGVSDGHHGGQWPGKKRNSFPIAEWPKNTSEVGKNKKKVRSEIEEKGKKMS